MDKFGLTQYIVTPEHLSWQKSGQSAGSIGFEGLDCLNDNWGDEKTYDDYSAWKNDYLWLPSIVETGFGDDTHIGLWETSSSQREIVTGGGASGTVFSPPVGSLHENEYVYTGASWLRSGFFLMGFITTNSDVVLINQGDYHFVDVNNLCAVRPALHLNLTKAATNAA